MQKDLQDTLATSSGVLQQSHRPATISLALQEIAIEFKTKRRVHNQTYFLQVFVHYSYIFPSSSDRLTVPQWSLRQA